MTVYIDLANGQFITQPAFKSVVERLEVKRGDAENFNVGFVSGNTLVQLAGTVDLRMMLKEDGKYDGDPLVSSSVFTYNATTGLYEMSPSFNTVELNSLLFSGDADDSNDVEYVDTMCEVTWSTDAGTNYQSSVTITARVHNDVIKGIEGVPLSGAEAYPSASLITDAFTDIDNLELDVDALSGAIDGIVEATEEDLGLVTYATLAEAQDVDTIPTGNQVVRAKDLLLRNNSNGALIGGILSGSERGPFSIDVQTERGSTQNIAAGSNSILMGLNSSILSGSDNCILLGLGSAISANADNNISIGNNTSILAGNTDNVSLGNSNFSTGGSFGATMIGGSNTIDTIARDSLAVNDSTVGAYGYSAVAICESSIGAYAPYSVAIGESSVGVYSGYSVAIGSASIATSTSYGVAIGRNVTIGTASDMCVAIGRGSSIASSSSNSTAIGGGVVQSISNNSIAIGANANVESSSNDSVAIGANAYVTSYASYAAAIGRFARAKSNRATAIGNHVNVGTSRAAEFGSWANAGTRDGGVKVHNDGLVSMTLRDDSLSGSSITASGASAGNEANGSLAPDMFTIQKIGNDMILYVNSGGTIKSVNLGTLA